MSKKRYGIILPEDTYRAWRFEAVKAGQSIGTWLEEHVGKEASVDKTVKKAIEPETVKETDKGKLTKGLGEMPWDLPPQPRPPADPSSGRFGHSRPAPKPGKK